MQTRGYGSRPDSELAARAAARDELAFAAMYESHFEGIYDFALRTVRDPDLAAEVIRNTFTKAWDRSLKGKARHQVKAWLYSIARERARHELGRRRGRAGDHPRLEPADELAFAQPDSSGASADEPDPEDQEAADLIWAIAADLTPKQYSLLDLHLRRGLTVDELAETLGFTKANTYIMLYRLREGFAESVSYALLARRGRSECRELATLLSQIRYPEDSPDCRRSVLQHVKTCPRCQASKRTYPSALEVFGSLALVPPRPGAQAAIWRDVSDHMHGIPANRMARRFEPRGGLRPRPEGGSARVNVPVTAVLAAGIVSIVAILLAGFLIFGTGGGGAATARDPNDVHSTDHKLGVPSSDNTIDLIWTAIPGAKAYSIIWSHAPKDLPDTVPDLPGTAISTTSPPLDPGTWYFHLRTQNEDGSWTSTLHIGPFEVLAGSPTPRPTDAPAASPTQTITPPPAPNFPTAPAATPTETPGPTPAPTATPAPTPPPPTLAPTSTLPTLPPTPTTRH